MIPFKLSSFGFVHDNGKQTYYLPKPLTLPKHLISENDQTDWGKEFKHRQFISLDTFKKWQRGEKLNLKQIIDSEKDSFWNTDIRIQHLTDNTTMATQIYRTGLVFYRENVCPYFIVDLDEKQINFADFIHLMQMLKHNGLGGRRTAGNGIFDFSEEDWFCLDKSENKDTAEIIKAREGFLDLFNFQSNTKFLFSLFYPDKMDQNEPVAYNLVLRKGWIYSSCSFDQLKRKTCYMFSEGSIFSKVSEGKLVDVTPEEFTEHRVYRYGVPFTIPFCEVMP